MVRMTKRDKKKVEYIQRLSTDGDFAKREERRKKEKESGRRKMRLIKVKGME